MERQTRTKKYSDLRNQLENNNETEGKTEGLSAYQDKLNSVEETLNNQNTSQVVEEPTVEDAVQDEEVIAEATEEALKPAEEENKSEEHSKVNGVEMEETVEEVEIPEEALTEDNNVAEAVEDTPVEEHEEIVETEKVETPEEATTNDNESALEEMASEILKEENSTKEPAVEEVEESVEEQINQTVVEEPTVETIIDSAEEEAKESQEEIITTTDDYLEKTLEEVNQYNKAQGLLTADDVPDRILGEVRGIAITETGEEAQEELNNTVTLEIKNILAAMEEDSNSENTEDFQEVNPEEVIKEVAGVEVSEEPVKEDNTDLNKLLETMGISKEAAEMLKPYLKDSDAPEEVKEVHEVKAQVLETPEATSNDDEVLEVIKIEEEIEKTKVNILNAAAEVSHNEENLLNDTIPFEIKTENSEDKKEEVLDEENAMPNKILNIILIVLIVILLAVLGVIIYWILLAQGIL